MDDDSFADEEGGLDLFAWRLTSLLHNEFVDTGLSLSQLPRQFQKVWGCGLPNPRDHGCGRKMIHLLRKLPQAVRVVNTSNTHTMLHAPSAGGAVALSVGGVGGVGGMGGVGGVGDVGGARSSEGGGGRDAGGGGVGAVAVSAASAARQVGNNSGKRKMEAEQEDNSNAGVEAGVSVDEARQLRRAARREEKRRKKATAATKRKDHPHVFPSGGGEGGGGGQG
jgi:hypothetical protein